jgi:hypothetical protein
MTRLTAALAVLLTTIAVSPAVAADDMSGGHPGMAEHNSIALGFHDVTAPIGVRWWFAGQTIGLDAGFGLGSDKVPGADESLRHWELDFGVPLLLKSWDRVHLIGRPGVAFGSQDVVTSVAPFAKDQETTVRLAAELEAEVFLVNDVSVSASHGISWNSTNPPGPGDNLTHWGTFGNNFTEVGFHVYLWGPYTHATMR